MKDSSSGATLECLRGDIARQSDVDAVVNAANSELRIGGGVAGALHSAAGPGLEEECRPLAPIAPGEAVLTGAHRLPNRFVIHCLGPIFGVDEPADRLLERCYVAALDLAARHGIGSIAFPAISTGAFRYPLEDATRVALAAVLGRLPRVPSVRRVRFVLFDERALAIYERTLAELLERRTP